MHDDNTAQDVTAVRPDAEIMTRQRLPYFIGLSANTAGTRGLSMHVVIIPPGAKAEPHMHDGYETGIYVLEGRVETRYGEGLAKSVVSEAGDFLFPKKEGAIDDSHIVGEIGEILVGTVEGRRTADEITLFKSLGLGVEDLAAASHVYAKAIQSGAGVSVELGGERDDG